jgi:hypothetical protein
LNATASVPGTFAYSPEAGTVLNAGAGQTLTVTFIPEDTTNYTTTTFSVPITVARATAEIEWLRPADITYGMPLGGAELNATASVPGTFAYAPAAGTVLNAGAEQMLTVTFTPADTINYTTATLSVPITVVRATPEIEWTPPAPIGQGTPLGDAQLNATANVAGTFTYSPPAGQVLQTGTWTLTARFAPADARNYQEASASVPITVVGGSVRIEISAASVRAGDAVVITGFVTNYSTAPLNTTLEFEMLSPNEPLRDWAHVKVASGATKNHKVRYRVPRGAAPGEYRVQVSSVIGGTVQSATATFTVVR